MFAHVVECESKTGRSELVGNKLKSDVLPILQKQPRFVDFITLSNKTNPNRLVCVSFWTSREDSEEYHRQHYDSSLGVPATLETFAVNASTAHRTAVGRAA
jgi:hypothetical protein